MMLTTAVAILSVIAFGITPLHERVLAAQQATAATHHLNNELFAAVESGNTAEVLALIDRGADINANNPEGIPPLGIAAQHNHPEIIALLVGMHAIGRSAGLYYAAEHGNEAMASLLITAGADINVRRAATNATPLHAAVSSNRHNVIELLLAADADINARDNHGNTPLHCATRNSNVRIARLLLNWGANPAQANNAGEVPRQLGSPEFIAELDDFLVAGDAP